ncbi:MAG: hypothetical protein PHQ86_04465 [Dehalococcoidales bacterium]|nr:hypothetical protein [Dehalococcoidales bacterium]
MPRYFMTWEIDVDKVPINREERAAAWSSMIDMVKQGMKEGKIKEWGSFVGEMKGYSISEGTEIETCISNQQWVPFVNFTVKPIASVSDIEQVITSLSK